MVGMVPTYRRRPSESVSLYHEDWRDADGRPGLLLCGGGVGEIIMKSVQNENDNKFVK